MFDLAVNGSHHEVEAAVGQGFAGTDGTVRKAMETVPQAAGETQHIQLFFDLFAHFRDVLSAAGQVSKQMRTNSDFLPKDTYDGAVR